MRQVRRRLAAALALTLLAGTGGGATTAAEPPGPDTLRLTAEQQRRLAEGRQVFLDVPGAQGAELPAVLFRVNADPATVWQAIGAFGSYPQWIGNVRRADVYLREGAAVNVSFEIKHWLIGELRYSIRHHYPWPDAPWGTFALDESRPSDLESASGFWRTYLVEDDPESTDVLYAAQLVPAGGAARLFRRSFARAGLRSATEWLRREAESPD